MPKRFKNVEVFQGMTETAKTTISNRSETFTLSGIYQATLKLLDKGKNSEVTEDETQLAILFWNIVANQIPHWKQAKKDVSSHELRNDFIHALTALQAIANCGYYLLSKQPKQWEKKLLSLQSIDWRRSSAKIWEGRALTAGRLNKSSNNVTLTSNLIKNNGHPIN